MPAYRIFIDPTTFVDIQAEAHKEMASGSGMPARLHLLDANGHVIASYNSEKIFGFVQREKIAPKPRE